VANESRASSRWGCPSSSPCESLHWLCLGQRGPIFIGSIGLAVFLLSIFAGCLPLLASSWWLRRRSPISSPGEETDARAAGGVLVGFLVFYFFRLIPPVPLRSVIGIYHAVEKTQDTYRLSHERPAWRIWHHGDQEFLAQPGDKVYVFLPHFSPTRFSPTGAAALVFEGRSRGWTLQDTIPIKILGGARGGLPRLRIQTNLPPSTRRL